MRKKVTAPTLETETFHRADSMNFKVVNFQNQNATLFRSPEKVFQWLNGKVHENYMNYKKYKKRPKQQFLFLKKYSPGWVGEWM